MRTYRTAANFGDRSGIPFFTKALLALAVIATFGSVIHPAGREGSPPKLVVLITIDQFRGDLIERYDKAFTAGFRRLLDRGYRFTRATVDHAPTNSYPGHVTLATGAYPARHGIIDNSWAEIVDGKLVMSSGAGDPTQKIIGFPKLEGVSPSKLQVTGFADWVLARDKKATVLNISSNEYGSLLHAGKTRGHTYWFSPGAGRYVTSTYYRNDYPAWVERFNRETLPKFLARKKWELTVPNSFKNLALTDASPHEFDSVHNTFPHRFENEVPAERVKDPQALADWFYFSPFTDEAALEFTKAAVRELKLGQGTTTDYLSVTLGATDSIGHRFGPLSLEQFDNLLRLDRGLGELLKFFDSTVGPNGYVVAVTGDHGASDIPEHHAASGGKAHRVTADDMDRMLKEIGDRVSAMDAGPEKIRAGAAEIAEKYPFVGDAITREDLAAADGGDPLLRLYRNSYHPARTPIYPIVSSKYRPPVVYGLRIRLAENAVPFFAPSNHGTPYFYDRHVGMIFMGAGILPGKSDAEARTVDVAPTLAAIAGIKVQGEIDGKPLPLDR